MTDHTQDVRLVAARTLCNAGLSCDLDDLDDDQQSEYWEAADAVLSAVTPMITEDALLVEAEAIGRLAVGKRLDVERYGVDTPERWAQVAEMRTYQWVARLLREHAAAVARSHALPEERTE